MAQSTTNEFFLDVYKHYLLKNDTIDKGVYSIAYILQHSSDPKMHETVNKVINEFVIVNKANYFVHGVHKGYIYTISSNMPKILEDKLFDLTRKIEKKITKLYSRKVKDYPGSISTAKKLIAEFDESKLK